VVHEERNYHIQHFTGVEELARKFANGDGEMRIGLEVEENKETVPALVLHNVESQGVRG